MSEPWLEIGDEKLDAQEIQRRITERMARRGTTGMGGGGSKLEGLDSRHGDVQIDGTRQSREVACAAVARWLQDCDIVPANYVIDWRVPILGPIHAVIRRVIHAEMRRFLLPALEKQSHLNRVVLQALAELCQENARLSSDLELTRQELAGLRPGQGPDD